jgi:pullulanase
MNATSVSILLRAGLCLSASWLLSGCSNAAISEAKAVSKNASVQQCDGNDTTVLAGEAQAQAARNAIFVSREWIRWVRTGSLTAGDKFRLVYSTDFSLRGTVGQTLSAPTGSFDLEQSSLPNDLQALVNYAGSGGTSLRLPAAAIAAIGDSAPLWAQWWIVHEDSRARIKATGALQWARFLDQRFSTATQAQDLGVSKNASGFRFKLWAPTAENVSLCLYADASANAYAVLPMQRDNATGIYAISPSQAQSGQYYRFIADVPVAGLGKVRNRSTDPYSISHNADSQRSYIADLNDPALAPAGWQEGLRGRELASQTDMQIYELHVRDFSLSDRNVRSEWRGKYLAFTETNGLGFQHLKAMSQAGLTDVHLLPAFDFATVPEANCSRPKIPKASANSDAQRQAVNAVRDRDCFNWGYDPLHFGSVEGSYATDANDGAVRIREFRAMVDAMHRLGLRVGMDVVYNHTTASGQTSRAVLDRLVPGYYQRYNVDGGVERSTCCDNTATEHLMMAKLMRDTLLRFVIDYRIDSFRFDLIGHQPKDVMVQISDELDTAAGRRINFIGEGWNFGEVANNARFVQATQANLQNTGIGTFTDRMRDAVRGGGCCDGTTDAVRRQGVLTGLNYARNAENTGVDRRLELLQSSDLVKLSLAGNLRDFSMTDFSNVTKLGAQFRYTDLPAGYVAEPSEVVNYVENHDNQTLFDISLLKLPLDTTMDDRARVQALGMALVAFAQGVAYHHAGIELMRSKAFDRNSFDSGDYFNRLDYSFKSNGFGPGLPPGTDASYDQVVAPRLANASLRVTPEHLDWTRRMFLSMLKLRSSTPLLRLPSAAEIKQRVKILNTGSAQIPTVHAVLIDGAGFSDSVHGSVLALINFDIQNHTLALPEANGAWRLHPEQARADYADTRVRSATASNGQFVIPARTAVLWVR